MLKMLCCTVHYYTQIVLTYIEQFPSSWHNAVITHFISQKVSLMIPVTIRKSKGIQ